MPKNKKVKLTDGVAVVMPIKKLGNDEDGKLVQSMGVINPDKSTVTNRFVDGKMVDQNYNPKKMKVKKMRKKYVAKEKPIEAAPTPNYTSKLNFSEEEKKIMDRQERIDKYNKKSRKKNKGVKRGKPRRTKNLVTGKTNIIR